MKPPDPDGLHRRREDSIPPIPPLPELARGLTVDVWVEATGECGGDLQVLVSQCDETDAGTFRLEYCDSGRSGAPAFGISTECGHFQARASTSLPAGFHHLAGTWDGSEVRLYVDGQLASQEKGTGRLAASALPVSVGRLPEGGGAFRGRVLHVGFSPLASTPGEILAMHHAHRVSEEDRHTLRIALDTYCVLDRREILHGCVHPPAGSTARMQARITRRDSGMEVWSGTFLPSQDSEPWVLSIPLRFTGYCLLEVRDDLGRNRTANLVIRKDRPIYPEKQTEGFLEFVQQSVDRILSEQSLKLRRAENGAEFVTTDLSTRIGFRSIGSRETHPYVSYWFPEGPFEYETFRADHDMWPVLDDLTRLTGDQRYRTLTDGMLDALRDSGFDPASGLPYFGEESDFDVAHAAPHNKRLASDLPKFKLINDGPSADMHISRLWERLPKETHRWLHSVHYGLVTNPHTMDFNRYCMYGFDDRRKKPSLTQNSAHCGFDNAGAGLVFLWSFCWAHTGDRTCLDWAERMTSKWVAVQNPETGLIPNYFGASEKFEPGAVQEPGKFAEMRNAALAAPLFLRAAVELRRHAGAESLASQLEDLGRRLALGVAHFSYDPSRRIFREHFHLDGRPYQEAARYCFHTQEQKDEAVRHDPLMAQVPVYEGSGLYRNPNYYSQMAGSAIPFHLGEAAALAQDRELSTSLERIAEDIADEAFQIHGAFTPEGRWTFCATGWYIGCLLRLHTLTGKTRHLDTARKLAEREIVALRAVETPHWWRLRERAIFLMALLRLHEAMKN